MFWERGVRRLEVPLACLAECTQRRRGESRGRDRGACGARGCVRVVELSKRGRPGRGGDRASWKAHRGSVRG